MLPAANENTDLRWKAVITYLADAGPVEFVHFFEEIEELDGIIENGPSWHAMDRCVVTLNNPTSAGMTIEQTEAA